MQNYSREQKKVLELIEMYKGMEFLWNKKHHDYTVQGIRKNAYLKLLDKYREIDEEGSLHGLKDRLSIMRCGYIRELKKVRESQRTAEGPESVYTPRLWYFDAFSFLEEYLDLDQWIKNREVEPCVSQDNDDDVINYETTEFLEEDWDDGCSQVAENEAIEFLDINYDCDDSSGSEEIPTKKSKIKTEHVNVSTLQSMSFTDEEYETMGKAIALQLRDIDPYQVTIAQKLISDAIFYAKLDRLSEQSHIGGTISYDH